MPAAARSPARLEPRCCTIMSRNTSVNGRLTSIVISQTPSRIVGARVARRMPSIHADIEVNSQLSTLNSQVSTLNSQLSTLNSQLSTLKSFEAQLRLET